MTARSAPATTMELVDAQPYKNNLGVFSCSPSSWCALSLDDDDDGDDDVISETILRG